ncbi:MAG: undecaprenyl-diphosphate phosphatase [Spirochaetota bacterium]
MLEAFILGAVQGVTEFLPVSSSTHLRFLHHFFGFDLSMNTVAFDITLHCATLLAVVIVFREEIRTVITGFMKALTPSSIKDIRRTWRKNEQLRFVIYVLTATALTFLVYFAMKMLGVPLKDTVSSDAEAERGMLMTFSAGLIVTGFILFASLLAKRYGQHRKPTVIIAIIVGIAQGLALFPGISRSGITITAALLSGISPAAAGSLSFLLSLPAVAGAALLDVKNIAAMELIPLAVGFISAFVFGYCALRLLIAMIRRGSFFVFGFYCIAAGVSMIVYLMR